MKAIKKTTRKYYKYQIDAWSQPTLSSNGTLGGDDFAVAQTGQYSTYQPYVMFTSNGNYLCANGAAFILYHPTGMNITSFYRTTASLYGISWMTAYYLSFSNDGVNWTNEIAVSTTYAATTTTAFSYSGYYKYTKIRPYYASSGTNPYAIGRVVITATYRYSVESTSSDYDYYKDFYTIKMWKQGNVIKALEE